MLNVDIPLLFIIIHNGISQLYALNIIDMQTIQINQTTKQN